MLEQMLGSDVNLNGDVMLPVINELIQFKSSYDIDGSAACDVYTSLNADAYKYPFSIMIFKSQTDINSFNAKIVLYTFNSERC